MLRLYYEIYHQIYHQIQPPPSWVIGTIIEGVAKDFPAARDMAKTVWNPNTINDNKQFTLLVRPGFFSEPPHRVEGVLVHEFGHMNLVAQGKHVHTEVEADVEGQRITRKRIGYDDINVQSTDPQWLDRLRPAHLL